MKKKHVTNWSLGLLLVSFLIVAGPILAYSFSLGPAPEGTGDLWVDSDTTLDLPPDGVLRYRNVTINNGAWLRFNRNANNTPVTFMVYSSMTINGFIDVSADNNSTTGMGGPGGYDGGKGGTGMSPGERGKGPGGGNGSKFDPNYNFGGGGGGGFGTAGGNGSAFDFTANGGMVYGNDYLVPLIGGSGGGGAPGVDPQLNNMPQPYGGGGGGAILIAATDTITLNGWINANGGNVFYWYIFPSGAGSGGAVKLVATTITGSGAIWARGGMDSGSPGNQNNGGDGGNGRIVLSCQNLNNHPDGNDIPTAVRTYPVYPINVAALTISSVGGVAVPAGAHASSSNPDIVLSQGSSNPVHVIVTAANIPTGSTVTVTATPQTNNNATQTGSATLTGTTESSTADVSVTLDYSTPTILMASVTYSISALMGDTPVYAEGERVKNVKVSSRLGTKGSTTTYITESGREVLARLY